MGTGKGYRRLAERRPTTVQVIPPSRTTEAVRHRVGGGERLPKREVNDQEASAMTTIGFLHPGAMGVRLAATISGPGANLDASSIDRSPGPTPIWASEGRSPQTASRAAEAGMIDVVTVDELCRRSDVVISICPPASAVEVAKVVAGTGFEPLYVDANAIAPSTSIEIGSLFGDRFIDGGVIGPPPVSAGTTRLYLAGPAAQRVAALWQGSALDARVLSDSAETGAASALKMAYAGWTKGSAALLLAVNALAEQGGVLESLHEEWDLSQPELRAQSSATAASVGPKAWRFDGEMAHIAVTMAEAGLPDGFHRAAELIYRQMAHFKDLPGPDLPSTLAAIHQQE